MHIQSNRLSVSSLALLIGASAPLAACSQPASPHDGGLTDSTSGDGSADPCAAQTTCGTCVSSTCGFCGATNQCMSGQTGACTNCVDEMTGPTMGTCTANFITRMEGCTPGTTSTNEYGTTSLSIDCRGPNGTQPRCNTAMPAMHGTIGTGVNLASGGIGSTWAGCFVDAANHRLIAAATNASSATSSIGMIAAVDLMTGNRTMVTGSWTDPSTGMVMMGSGPSLGEVVDVKPGASGHWYAANASQVFDIDPATGARTLYWDGTAAGQGCMALGSAVFPAGEMAIASDGTIYMNTRGNQGGDVIVAIHHNSCSLVWDASMGTGPDLSQTNFVHVATSAMPGVLYVTTDPAESVLAINLTTHNWTVLSSDDPSGMVGTGGAIGTSGGSGTMLMSNGQLWVMGYSGTETRTTFTRIDPATGNRNTFFETDLNSTAPKFVGGTGECFAQIPGQNYFVVSDAVPLSGGGTDLVYYEPTTGLEYLLSN